MAFRIDLTNNASMKAFRSRRRLNTDHTAESFDSGISSLDTYLVGRQTKTRRHLQIDDVLWCCVFILTVWYFELPISLFTDRRLDRFYMSCSVLCMLGFILIGLYLSATTDNSLPADDWPKVYPRLFSLAIIMFIFSCIMFCISTWSMWNMWSIYIVFVSFMFTIVVVSFM